VTTIQEVRPRVQRMLVGGYGLEKIDEEIEAIEGLDPEEKSALWVWAWRQRYMARQALANDQGSRRSSRQLDY
jgi:hypothetical protein